MGLTLGMHNVTSDEAYRIIKTWVPTHHHEGLQKILDELQEDSYDAGYQQASSYFADSDGTA